MTPKVQKREAELTRARSSAIHAVCLGLALSFFFTAALSAGSIFMKNGYILQGRIVDRDETGVILGWPNGKMAVAHRFVETVIFEPGEEERILLLEKARQEEGSGEEANDLTMLGDSTTTVPELPSNLDTLIRTMNIKPRDPASNALVASGGGDPDFGLNDPTLQTDVSTIDAGLADPVTNDGVGVSIRPPQGWVNQSGGDYVAFVESESTDGFRSRLNIVSWPRGPLSSDDYIDGLKEKQEDNIEGFELLSEGPTNVGGRQSYEFVGRGEHSGETAVFRQLIVVGENQVWLFSMFTPDEGDDADLERGEDMMALMDQALESVELLRDGSDSEDN